MKNVRPPTIRDMARALGVSTATVSRALNDHPNVSEAMKKRVRALAEEMGYVPNAVARSLNTKSTRTVGIVVPRITEGYLPWVVTSLSDLLVDRGYTSYNCYTEDSPYRERQCLEMMLARRVDGLIWVPAEGEVTQAADVIQTFLQRGIPVICVDRYLKDLPVDIVATDNRLGAYHAVSALVRDGHRRIAYVYKYPEVSAQRDRFEGYRQALEEAGLEVDEELVAPGGTAAEIDLAIQKMLQLEAPPTAIFCRNDLVAVRVLAALKRRHIRVPEDMSLICFDPPSEALDLIVQMSYVRQPAQRIAFHALQLLMERMAVGLSSYTPRKILLTPDIVWRHSCAPPGKGSGKGEER